MDWQVFESAPRDGREIFVTRKVGAKPFPLPPHNLLRWDGARECWMQKVDGQWHRKMFYPTHWREP